MIIDFLVQFFICLVGGVSSGFCRRFLFSAGAAGMFPAVLRKEPAADDPEEGGRVRGRGVRKREWMRGENGSGGTGGAGAGAKEREKGVRVEGKGSACGGKGERRWRKECEWRKNGVREEKGVRVKREQTIEEGAGNEGCIVEEEAEADGRSGKRKERCARRSAPLLSALSVRTVSCTADSGEVFRASASAGRKAAGRAARNLRWSRFRLRT